MKEIMKDICFKSANDDVAEEIWECKLMPGMKIMI